MEWLSNLGNAINQIVNNFTKVVNDAGQSFEKILGGGPMAVKHILEGKKLDDVFKEDIQGMVIASTRLSLNDDMGAHGAIKTFFGEDTFSKIFQDKSLNKATFGYFNDYYRNQKTLEKVEHGQQVGEDDLRFSADFAAKTGALVAGGYYLASTGYFSEFATLEGAKGALKTAGAYYAPAQAVLSGNLKALGDIPGVTDWIPEPVQDVIGDNPFENLPDYSQKPPPVQSYFPPTEKNHFYGIPVEQAQIPLATLALVVGAALVLAKRRAG